MLQGLVEEIRQLQIVSIDGDPYGICFIDRDAVLDIIQDKFAEKDKPDCEGWWWVKRVYDKMWTCVYVYQVGLSSDNKFQYPEWCDNKWDEELSAKWIKAIVPAKEGE